MWWKNILIKKREKNKKKKEEKELSICASESRMEYNVLKGRTSKEEWLEEISE